MTICLLNLLANICTRYFSTRSPIVPGSPVSKKESSSKTLWGVWVLDRPHEHEVYFPRSPSLLKMIWSNLTPFLDKIHSQTNTVSVLLVTRKRIALIWITSLKMLWNEPSRTLICVDKENKFLFIYELPNTLGVQ